MVNIEELYDEKKHIYFVQLMINLFTLNEYTYKMFNYKINEISHFNIYYYDILPYKIENYNISFIIDHNKDVNELIFYFYNFDINEGINKPKKIINENYYINDINIQNKIVRYQINYSPTFIICFTSQN